MKRYKYFFRFLLIRKEIVQKEWKREVQREVDKIVYELYGLSEDEVRMVEKSLK